MLSKLKKSNKEGFTIIEVLIVLAIAGLIILIVLLAIPALQRNGRNTAIKSDAGALAGGVGDYASTNDGALPTKAKTDVATPGLVKLNNAVATNTEVVAKVQSSTKVILGTDAEAAEITPAAGEITLTFGTKCDVANAEKYKIVVSSRSTSIVYSVESSGSDLQARCLDA